MLRSIVERVNARAAAATGGKEDGGPRWMATEASGADVSRALVGGEVEPALLEALLEVWADMAGSTHALAHAEVPCVVFVQSAQVSAATAFLIGWFLRGELG